MRVRRLVAWNLFERNDVYRFDPLVAAQRRPVLPPLAGLSVVCKPDPWDLGPDAMETACAEEAGRLISSRAKGAAAYRLWMLVAHAWPHPASRLVRYWRLWKGFGPSLPAGFRLGPEVSMESSEGIRYAGVARVPEDRLPAAIQLLRDYGAFALIMSERGGFDSEDGVRSLFAAAFPPTKRGPATAVQWQHLAEELCPLGDVLVKAGPLFDDPEAYVTFILSPDTMKALGWAGP